MLVKMLPFKTRGTRETFDSILLNGLGRTICRDFYFPYALKLWGLPTDALSPVQARRRVSAGSFGKMVRKVFSALPGVRRPGTGRYFYPRGGFGQITRAMAAAARDRGARFLFGSNVSRITLGDVHRIEIEQEGRNDVIEVERIWSTIPITVLVGLVHPAAPQHVIEASQRIQYRGMILIYLVLATNQYTPFDAHYFPETDIPLSRMSEPKNYAARAEPAGRTVLCGELPCRVGDELWTATDQELAKRVGESLARCDLPTDAPVVEVVTRRLPQAYPIYTKDYEAHFRALDEWVGGLERVLTFGRQGLFAHDNTHHALAMSYAAVDCLDSNGDFDADRWSTYRRQFERHVVED
jgi:protoporphyrinogen oxidase